MRLGHSRRVWFVSVGSGRGYKGCKQKPSTMTGSMVGACVTSLAASRPKKPIGSLPSWVAGHGYNMILRHSNEDSNCPIMTAPTPRMPAMVMRKVRGDAQLSALLTGSFNVQADQVLTVLSKNCNGSGMCMFPGPGSRDEVLCATGGARPATIDCSAYPCTPYAPNVCICICMAQGRWAF